MGSLPARSVTSTSQSFSPQIGTSYAPTVMMSYWPPPVATSLVIAFRRSPSSRKMMLTLMSGCSLLNSGSSRLMSCICGLLTLASVSVVTPGLVAEVAEAGTSGQGEGKADAEACYSQAALLGAGHGEVLSHQQRPARGQGSEHTSPRPALGSYERSGSLMRTMAFSSSLQVNAFCTTDTMLCSYEQAGGQPRGAHQGPGRAGAGRLDRPAALRRRPDQDRDRRRVPAQPVQGGPAAGGGAGAGPGPDRDRPRRAPSTWRPPGRLAERFGLRHAIVVDTPDDDPVSLRRNLGQGGRRPAQRDRHPDAT